jgi:hypothetical protein
MHCIAQTSEVLCDSYTIEIYSEYGTVCTREAPLETSEVLMTLTQNSL